MSTQIRTIAAILVCLLTGSLYSCGDTAVPSDTTTAETTETTTVVTTEAPPPIPQMDFEGADLPIFVWPSAQILVEEETGDELNDTIFRRNSRVQDEYNVNFKFTSAPGGTSTYDAWITTVDGAIMAGDNSIQLIGGWTYRLALDTIDGSFHNLNAVSTIDFTQPWWLGDMVETCNIGGKMFVSMGHMDSKLYTVNYAIYFNKNLAEAYQLPDLYKAVDDGIWTLDMLQTLVQKSTKDLNGDSVIDLNDQYGYLTGKYQQMDAFVHACDIRVSEMGEDGLPRLIGLTEKYVNAQQKVRDFVLSPQVYYGTEDIKALFMNRQGLFLAASINTAHTMREMEDDFGILPYPKWDEEQQEYGTYCCIGDTTGYAVPVTADAEKIGAVMEAMAYYGYTDILPVYYERALKTKSARDNDSARMLDIIFENIHFDFTEFYSFCFGDQKSPPMLMRRTIKDGLDIASTYASDKPMYDSTMQKILDSLR